MESFLPSEVGRLIYGYLLENDEELADMFLNHSKVMEECRLSKMKSRRFNAKVQGLSLVDILDQYSILCSLISKNVNNTERVHRNILNLLRKVLYSSVRERDKLVADNLLTLDFSSDVSVHNHGIENRSEPVVCETVQHAVNTEEAEVDHNVHENMDVSSSSTVNDSHTVSKVVEQSVQTEPVESISLLENNFRTVAISESTEMNIDDGNSTAENRRLKPLPEESSPIDLTSPRQSDDLNPSNSNENIDKNQKGNGELENIDLTSTEINTAVEPNPQPNLPKSQSECLTTPPSDAHTPPDNVKRSRIRDNSVFNNLTLNPNSRRESYLTPLKHNKNYVFGENILYINNNNIQNCDKPETTSSRTNESSKVHIPATSTHLPANQSKSTVHPARTNTKSKIILIDSMAIPKPNDSDSKTTRKGRTKLDKRPSPKRSKNRAPAKTQNDAPVDRTSTDSQPEIANPKPMIVAYDAPNAKSSESDPRLVRHVEKSNKIIPPKSTLKLPSFGQENVKYLKSCTINVPRIPCKKLARQSSSTEASKSVHSKQPEISKTSHNNESINLIDTVGDTMLPDAKLPWDLKLRNFVAEATEQVSKSPRKTPRKRKEMNKRLDSAAKKRKIDPESTSKVKRNKKNIETHSTNQVPAEPTIVLSDQTSDVERVTQETPPQIHSDNSPSELCTNEAPQISNPPINIVPSSIDIINNIMTQAAKNAAIDINPANEESENVESDPPQIMLSIQDFVIYEANLNI